MHRWRLHRQQAVYGCTCAVTSSFFSSNLPALTYIGQFGVVFFFVFCLSHSPAFDLFFSLLMPSPKGDASLQRLDVKGRLKCVASSPTDIVTLTSLSLSLSLSLSPLFLGLCPWTGSACSTVVPPPFPYALPASAIVMHSASAVPDTCAPDCVCSGLCYTAGEHCRVEHYAVQ